MGIYDPVLQAYQHGVDQRIQLASQPMTLAQSILGGYQQGFGNRMQRERMDLERQQLEEAKRRAMASEEESRRWHQGQEQNRLAQILQGVEITDNDQLGAWRKRIEGAGLPGEMLPKQLQQDPGNVAAQGNYDANQQAAEESPYDMAGPGGSSFQAERPADKLKPWRGSALGQKYAETERKASHNQVMEGLAKRKLDQADVDQLRKQGLTDAQIDAINFKIERGEELLPYEKNVLGERAALYRRLPQGASGSGGGDWRSGMRPDQQQKMVSEHWAVMKKEWESRRNAAMLQGNLNYFMQSNLPPTIKDAEADLDRSIGETVKKTQATEDNPAPPLQINKGGLNFRGASGGGSYSRGKDKLGIAPPGATEIPAEKTGGLVDGAVTDKGNTIKKIGSRWYIIPKGQ